MPFGKIILLKGFFIMEKELIYKMVQAQIGYTFVNEYLEKNGYIQYMTMRKEIGEPAKEKAINQLEILARRGYFSIPAYDFEEVYDNNGNPIWKCKCVINEYSRSYVSKSSSKKESKKISALKMLNYVIEEDEKDI